MSSKRLQSALSKLALALLALSYSAACVEEPEFEVGETGLPVEIETQGYWEVVRGATANDIRARSTGAIQYFRADGIWASCGATFISPKHAVTADHCIRHSEPGDLVTIKEYDTEHLSVEAYREHAKVEGQWPNWQRSHTLTPLDGYSYTSHECAVVTHCEFGRANCPFERTVDIGLLECATREDDAPWVDSRPITESNQQVSMFWFHEVVDLTNVASPDNYSITDRDYGSWHYQVEHQLLPLVSTTTRSGIPYRVVYGSSSRAYFSADVPLCHGSSGSGVFQGNNFLGPAVYGPNIVPRLCHAMDETSPGTEYLEAVASRYTAQFAAMALVRWQRLAPQERIAVLAAVL